MTAHLDHVEIAHEVALDLADGSYVNLGIGLPLLVASALPPGREVVFHSENGILGMGPPAAAGDEDWDLIDAGKRAVTLRPGGSFISHADSFSIIRGAHLDICVMGAYQVSGSGDLANWSTGTGVPGVGGAMDLAVGAKQIYVMMRHTTREDEPTRVAACTLPLTAQGVVTRVYTELGIFSPSPDGGFEVLGLARGVDIEMVRAHTDAPVRAAAEVVELPRPEPLSTEHTPEAPTAWACS
jgi:3-oxoadipate CoA-transferase beta subunit